MLDNLLLIGARGGSKRVPKKNLQLINDIPLIAYSIEMGLKLGIPTYVSTDNLEIASISKSWGAHVIERPKELALDISTDYDWILHAINKIPTDKIVFLRPTTPFRQIKIVKKAITSFFDKKYTSLRSVQPLKEAIQKTFTVETTNLIPAYPGIQLNETNLPNQFFSTSFTANGYVDILKSEVIKQGDIYGNKIQAYITPNTLDIDNWDDLKYANWRTKNA